MATIAERFQETFAPDIFVTLIQGLFDGASRAETQAQEHVETQRRMIRPIVRRGFVEGHLLGLRGRPGLVVDEERAGPWDYSRISSGHFTFTQKAVKEIEYQESAISQYRQQLAGRNTEATKQQLLFDLNDGLNDAPTELIYATLIYSVDSTFVPDSAAFFFPTPDLRACIDDPFNLFAAFPFLVEQLRNSTVVERAPEERSTEPTPVLREKTLPDSGT